MRFIGLLLVFCGSIMLQGCCTCIVGQICHFTPSSGTAAETKASPKKKAQSSKADTNFEPQK